jgi:ABC-type dipeptide/oligopeptide/nickel transport system permease component
VANYILRRLFWVVVSLFGISAITYFITYGIPANPARLVAGQHATPATLHAVALALHLNLPVWQRYLLYLEGAVLHGNLGYSYVFHRPALGMVEAAAPPTLLLAVAALLAELLLGVPVGIISATRYGSKLDQTLMVLSILGVSMPTYWFGVLLLYIFGFLLGWFPMAGYSLAGVVLPALSVGISGSAYYARILRSTILDVMHQDYVRTARAKGLPERGVLWRHIVRNALIPFVTYMGMDFGSLLGGLIVSEVVFGWPGLGMLLNQAIGNLDAAVIQAITVYAAAAIVIVNLLVDLVYAFLDPRIQYA